MASNPDRRQAQSTHEVREKNRRKLPFLSPHHPILARHPPTCLLITRQIGPAVKPSGYMSLDGTIRP